MMPVRLWVALRAAVAVLGLLTLQPRQAYQAGAAAERWATLNRSFEVLRERMTLAFVPHLTACSQTAPVSKCDGWRKLTLAAQTRAFIIEHDRPFAEGVAAHNGFGMQRGRHCVGELRGVDCCSIYADDRKAATVG